MNILGINGSIGWDGNISMALPDFGEMWVHGSGATLVMDGVLKNAETYEIMTPQSIGLDTNDLVLTESLRWFLTELKVSFNVL